MHEEERQESGKLLAFSLILMNGLILTAIGGVFWLIQVILMQISHLEQIRGACMVKLRNETIF